MNPDGSVSASIGFLQNVDGLSDHKTSWNCSNFRFDSNNLNGIVNFYYSYKFAWSEKKYDYIEFGSGMATTSALLTVLFCLLFLLKTSI